MSKQFPRFLAAATMKVVYADGELVHQADKAGCTRTYGAHNIASGRPISAMHSLGVGSGCSNPTSTTGYLWAYDGWIWGGNSRPQRAPAACRLGRLGTSSRSTCAATRIPLPGPIVRVRRPMPRLVALEPAIDRRLWKHLMPPAVVNIAQIATAQLMRHRTHCPRWG